MEIDPDTGAPPASIQWRRPLIAGLCLIAVGFGGFGAWAAVARLDGAIVAPGVVAVESYKKTVQHLEGGIVREIRVRDGDQVKAGDVLVRLDPTRPQASLGLLRGQLAAALAAEARLVAERDDLDSLTFPEEVSALRVSPLVERAVVDQEKQFASGRETVRRQVSVTEAQVEQIYREIEGLKIEQQSSEGQLVFVERELVGLRSLFEKQLTELPKLSAKEREQLRLKSTIAQGIIAEAKAGQKIGELKMQLEQLRQQRREVASKELPDLRKAIADLRQQISVAQDTLERIDILAPTTGMIQQLRIYTIGGVVRPGDPILDIVPESDELVVRAQVSPLDVDLVRPGMAAEVRFPAFHRAFVPFIMGTVRSSSRDRIVEPNKDPYFATEIIVDRNTIPPDIQAKLIAGQSADVIITTGERTALEYLVSPILDRLHLGMRER